MAENFLIVVNHHFLEGAEVVQAYSEPRHPDRSPLESLAYLGFALNRNLRYHGRSRLGWSANLMGTGMCFARNIIEKYGWNTTTMVEDIEYGMFLQLQGIRVVFAHNARISVELHKDIDQSQGQRTRWDMGKFEVRNKYLPQLLKKGIKEKNISYFDSSMELLLPPFSLFVIMLLGCFSLYVLFDFQKGTLNFYIWISILLSLTIYIFIGLLTARASFKVYRSLLYAPFFLIWRFWIILLESCKGKNKQRQW
jgi:cellulose synthase/poly-beta-1,6-N-acetylglucosamine synthase-like glycosyltransferase